MWSMEYDRILAIILASALTLGSGRVSGAYDQRPAYHITPEQGHWLNDPNGPMLYNGYYHLFYQYNPYDSVWGNMSWGHVVSQDLVYWERLPVAMHNDHAYDINGVFSGSAVITPGSDGGMGDPYLFYTCVDADDVELQCLAQRDAASATYQTTLEDWQKSAENPIIAQQPSDSWDAKNFRDPALWNTVAADGSLQWNMIAAASHDSVGVVALYTTAGASFPFNWSYAPTGDGANFWDSTSESAGFHTWMVECPDFFPVTATSAYEANTDDLYVLKYSIMETRQEYYEIGRYVDDGAGSAFIRDVSYADVTKAPQTMRSSNANLTGAVSSDGAYPALLLDYGPHNTFYASKTFFDDARAVRVLWGWSPEQDAAEFTSARDWQGVQSLPRRVSFDSEAKILRTHPATGIENLRAALVYQWPQGAQSQPSTASTTPAKLSSIQALHPSNAIDIKKLPARGLQLEINAHFQASAGCSSLADLVGAEFGLAARISGDNSAYTKYGFSIKAAASSGVMRVDAGAMVYGIMDSSFSGGSTPAQVVEQAIPGQWNVDSMFVDASTGRLTFSMQLFLDHSMTELFLQDGALAATMRVYPAEEAQDLAWYTNTNTNTAGLQQQEADGGDVCAVELAFITVHSMGTIWK